MTELSHDPQRIPWGTGSGLAKPTHLSASRIVQKIQSTGSAMLKNPNLTEVDEGIFSTCSEPIEKFHERLLRARDIRVPLVEVSVLPQEMVQDALREVFQIDSSAWVIRSILRSNGRQEYDTFWGNNIGYTDVGISIPGMHSISLTGEYGSEITAVLMTGTLNGYDDSRVGRRQPDEPITGGSFEYEHDCFYDGVAMDSVLDIAAEEFATAVARDGVIDSTARAVTKKPNLGQGFSGELS